MQGWGLASEGGAKGLDGEKNGERFEEYDLSLSVDIKETRQGSALTCHSVPQGFD